MYTHVDYYTPSGGDQNPQPLVMEQYSLDRYAVPEAKTDNLRFKLNPEKMGLVFRTLDITMSVSAKPNIRGVPQNILDIHKNALNHLTDSDSTFLSRLA